VELGLDLKLLVFDLDGTLIHLDVDWSGLRARLTHDGGLADGEGLGVAIQRLALAGDPLAEVVTEYELAGLGGRTVAPAVGQALARLAGSHHVAVLTRNSSRVARQALAAVPGAEHITVVGREECPRLKPAPDGLRLIMSELGIAADRTALVGDTDHDVRAAAAAGVTSIVVRNDRLERPPEGADHYLDNLNDLFGLLALDGKAHS